MKPRFTLKQMLTATACCVLITLVDVVKHCANPIRLVNPRDFLTVFYWIILLIGWSVYFLDRFKKK